MGGITEQCKIFPQAAVRNVTLMPHTFYEGPGLGMDLDPDVIRAYLRT